jgi:hypothetical protein
MRAQATAYFICGEWAQTYHPSAGLHSSPTSRSLVTCRDHDQGGNDGSMHAIGGLAHTLAYTGALCPAASSCRSPSA